MYQFIKRNHIEQIHLHTRDIAILRAHGWRFVYVPVDIKSYDFQHAFSCVDLSKRAINAHSIFIQTPHALYKHLTKK